MRRSLRTQTHMTHRNNYWLYGILLKANIPCEYFVSECVFRHHLFFMYCSSPLPLLIAKFIFHLPNPLYYERLYDIWFIKSTIFFCPDVKVCVCSLTHTYTRIHIYSCINDFILYDKLISQSQRVISTFFSSSNIIIGLFY